MPSAALRGQDRSTSPNSSVADVLRANYAAIAHRDTATLRANLADNAEWTTAATGAVVSKRALIQSVAQLPQLVTLHYDVDSVNTLVLGSVATAEYRLTDRRSFRGYATTHVSRALDVFALEHGRWRLVRHSQTWIVSTPATIALDSAALSEFVGRYDHGSGYIDDVHFVGSGLVATSSAERAMGAVGAHLIPVSSDAFSPDGIASLIVFERDSAGRVVDYVQQSPDGAVTRARRIGNQASRSPRCDASSLTR